jgi:hypothetical protein
VDICDTSFEDTARLIASLPDLVEALQDISDDVLMDGGTLASSRAADALRKAGL